MITSLQTSVLQRKPETNSAFGCSGRLNALLFFREDVSSPRLKVRKGKMPTDTCRHHEFAFLAHFLRNCNFCQLKVGVSTAGRTVAGVLVTFHCETTPCVANGPPWACQGWLIGKVVIGGWGAQGSKLKQLSWDTLVSALPQNSLQRWVWQQTREPTAFSICFTTP